MQLDVVGQTDVGLKREINQDSILIDKELNLFVVADGMGGHRGGEVASALAVETVQQFLRKNSQDLSHDPKKTLTEAYRMASTRIHEKSTREQPDLMGMGTTMVVMVVVEKKAFIANVGDSRVYLFQKPYLWQLTEDHSLINEQVRAGVISEDEAPHIIGRNVITRSVGFEREVMVDVIEREIQPNEIFLLCSDGLSSLVPDETISQICRTENPQQIVTKCIQEAKRAGGDDNVSVIVIRSKVD